MGKLVKYYIYVSDTKVDMIYPQIEQHLLKRIAAELRIDISVLGTGMSATIKSTQSEETRYSKLKVVVNYIEKYLDVGTVDAPSAYFKGTLPMRWGPLSDSESGIVYFGSTIGKRILGLGGSLHHVIGNNKVNKEGSQTHASSATPYLLSVLTKELRLPQYEDLETSGLSDVEMEEGATAAVELATERLRGPKQQLEFLAKTLLQGPSSYRQEHTVILGSPIYVALVD